MINAAADIVEFFRIVSARLRAYPGLTGFCVMVVFFAVTMHLGFALQDEPFEWYGAQRVLAGDIPLRDFDSYDPARYYWAAAVMALLQSHGFIAFRISLGLCAALGMLLANRLIFRAWPAPGLWLLLTTSISLIIWMTRFHKVFDVVASIALVMSLAWLLEQPTRRRFFVNGAVVGMVAIIGRNHGVYGVVAGALGLGFVVYAEKRAAVWPSFLCWCAGIVIGYAPMLLAILLVPGFWAGLWATIQVFFEFGATHYPVEYPWPWLVPMAEPIGEIVRYLFTSFLMIGVPLFGVGGLLYFVWRVRVQKLPADYLVLAAAMVSIPYTHFASQGLGHLEQAIFPMFIGIFAVVVGMPRWPALALSTTVCVLSLFLLVPDQDFYARMTDPHRWLPVQIGQDTLTINWFIAKRISVLARLVQKYAPGDREFVAEPFIPGAYALFDRRAAVWNPYALFPADGTLQEKEIARIQKEQPGFVLITTGPYPYQLIDPMVYNFITRNFVRTVDPAIPPQWGWELYLPPQVMGQKARDQRGGIQVK
ncbi:MAG TPA: hypothetical protein VGV16_01925 [Gammaproteobacteria bacterium]|nr:hypothetical protein [Gammaproteobacteria bacterium]